MTSLNNTPSDDESERAFVARATKAIAGAKNSSNGVTVSAEDMITNLTARLVAARTRDIAFRSGESGQNVNQPTLGE